MIDSLENGEIGVNDFVSAVIEAGTIDDTLASINEHSKALEESLYRAVSANSDELLQNATDVKFLRDNVIEIKGKIRESREKTLEIFDGVMKPYNEIVSYTHSLEVTYEESRILRTLIKFLSLVKRKGSDTRRLQEIRRIIDSKELDGLEIYQDILAKLKE